MLVVRKGMFQSTHPRGVRLLTVHLNFTYYGFNPRTHVGCDDEFKERFDSITFQSTHPRGVRLTPSAIFEGLIVFQSTHPRGVRPSSNRTARHRSSCFNPRTHVGCDRAVRTVFTGDALSFNPRTHVGCDLNTPSGRFQSPVSIHAPTWGATPSSTSFMASWKVSIHAPTWGATSLRTRLLAGEYCFNPRTHVGCDLTGEIDMFKRFLFQSTHPRGVRPLKSKRINSDFYGFNPRTHVGCDRFVVPGPGIEPRFNPRTHVGCDVQRLIETHYDGEFQSTHPRGVRLKSKRINSDFYGFNPRTHVGCDLVSVEGSTHNGGFNPRTHVGCDRLPRMPPPSRTCFNPRTHVGCDRGICFRRG